MSRLHCYWMSCCFSVELHCNHIVIVSQGAIIVHEVYEDGAAFQDGRLVAGDQILQVSQVLIGLFAEISLSGLILYKFLFRLYGIEYPKSRLGGL